jgi:hypothetical protein
MRYVVNMFGNMKLVTLKQFLKEIPVKTLDYQYPYYGFYARFRPKKGIEAPGDFPIAVGEYKSLLLVLKKGDTETILKQCLIGQSEYDFAFGGVPISDLFWYICGENAKAGGSPTHLVRISSRVWLAANNKEFLIVKNNNGIGLVCKQPIRTVLTAISKLSKKEASDLILKSLHGYLGPYPGYRKIGDGQ